MQKQFYLENNRNEDTFVAYPIRIIIKTENDLLAQIIPYNNLKYEILRSKIYETYSSDSFL